MTTNAHTIMSTNALDATNYHSGTALEIREYHYTTTSNGTGMDQAPRIGFHWGGRVQRQLGLNASGNLVTSNNGANWYELIHAGNISSQSVNYANSAGSCSSAVYTMETSVEQNSVYNTSGKEWSYLSSLRSDGAYGAVIKFGYNDGTPTAYIKGKSGSSWYSGWRQFMFVGDSISWSNVSQMLLYKQHLIILCLLEMK